MIPEKLLANQMSTISFVAHFNLHLLHYTSSRHKVYIALAFDKRLHQCNTCWQVSSALSIFLILKVERYDAVFVMYSALQ